MAREAVLVPRLPHAERATALVVELRLIVHHLLRDLEQVVIPVLDDERVPGRIKPRIHPLDPCVACGGHRGPAPVLAHRLLRPFAHVIVVLRMAGEAVHLKRPGDEPALTVPRGFRHRVFACPDPAAGECVAKVPHPLPGGKPALVVQRHRSAGAISGAQEPWLAIHPVDDVVRASSAEMRTSRHPVDLVALSARLLLGYRGGKPRTGGDRVAIPVNGHETMHRNRPASIEIAGHRHGTGHRRNRQSHESCVFAHI